MIVEFSIRPIRQPTVVAGDTETMDRVESKGRGRSMSASIEGSWDEAMSVIRGCHQAHANGHPRVVTTIVVVDDNISGHINGLPRLLHEMIPPAEAQPGHAAPLARRIPVEFRQ